MRCARAPLAALALAACIGDAETGVVAAGVRPPGHPPVAGRDHGGVVASVTGGTEHSFFQGELRRRVSFSARRHADGLVDGHFRVVLQGPDRRTLDGRSGADPIHYEVTCLALDGNRAWIGGRIVGGRNDPYRGGEDVWYVEDGAAGEPDRAAVWIGRAARRCTERSPATGWPSERGTLAVRPPFPGA